MIEDIKLVRFPKESGAYLFKVDDEVIYVGSSKNLYHRISVHKTAIKKGSEHGYKQDLYYYLQSNKFTVEIQLTDNYRQLEQELIEKYHPKYNSHRAYTGVGPRKGREAEYNKERYQKYKDEILGQVKQYYEANKEQYKEYHKSDKYKKSHRKASNKYNNQLCCYNNEVLTLATLSKRFQRAGIPHTTTEAKKYLIRSNDEEYRNYSCNQRITEDDF